MPLCVDCSNFFTMNNPYSSISSATHSSAAPALKIFESLPALYLILSPDLVIQAVSDAYLRETLTVREELLGKYVFDAFPDNPEAPEANAVTNLKASLLRVLSTGKPHEMPLQHYDVPRAAAQGGGFETRYWLPLNTPVLGDKGEVLYIIHQVTNVTEQVLRKQEGEQNEVLLQGLADTSPVALWLTDTTGAITYVNQTWVDWTGRPFEVHLGKGWEMSVAEEDRERALLKLKVAFDARSAYHIAFRICHVNGTFRWCAAEGVPRFLSDGSFAGFVGSCNDITQHKQSEEQLQLLTRALASANEQLASMNQELVVANQDLGRANKQLRHTNADLDNFIYTASHDLKAPIYNIEGLVQELLHQLPAESLQQEGIQQITRMIQGSVERFRKTIEHLTEVTKLQKGHNEEATLVHVQTVVEEVLLDLEKLVKEAGAQVEVAVAECPAVSFSEKNLRSIIYNLVSNAIKYRAPERRPVVRLFCQEEAGLLVLHVQDNGLGMSQKQQEQLFSMFKRFHDHVEGSGIGLYMVKRIVDNVGGHIAVESEIGKGTTFKVYLKL